MAEKRSHEITVNLSLNGTTHNLAVESRATLWELLTEKLRMPGTVRSCNMGTCGACTVLINGRPFYSCHILASDVEGKNISTIDSGAEDRTISTLQKAAYANHAAQCGYCTSGWLIAAKTLLDKTLDISEEDVKEALAGHLCRCGSYTGIIRSVLVAAEGMKKKKGTFESGTHHSVIINKPVRAESPNEKNGGKIIVEGDDRIETVKWQNHPPLDLKIVGKPVPPLPEISMPKIRGEAEYATRVIPENTLYAKILGSPFPRATIKDIDTSDALQIPGVHLIITSQNSPRCNPLSEELNYQGDLVAVAVAESENLAEDALHALRIEYEEKRHVGSLDDAMNPGAEVLRPGGNILHLDKNDPAHSQEATAQWTHGNLKEGFDNSEIVKEYSYRYSGATVLPLQPLSGVAEWDGSTLTFHGMAQGINWSKRMLAQWLDMKESDIRYVDKWNGGTFGSRMTLKPLDGLVAYAAMQTGRPVKYSLSMAEGLSMVSHKPEILQKFKVGLKRDGTIIALRSDAYQTVGFVDKTPTAGTPLNESARDHFLLYGVRIPNWQLNSYCYKTNTTPVGAVRSNTQQEFKFGFECMMDELAEEFGYDPLEYKLKFASRPGDILLPAKDWGKEFGEKIELENGGLKFDSYGSIEVITEGARLFGWNKRTGGTHPDLARGGLQKGTGVAVVDHHGGQMGWKEGELGFQRSKGDTFNSEIVLDGKGIVTLKNVQPESGTDHDTSIAQTVSEVLGFSSISNIRLLWGDSAIGVDSAAWFGGRTNTLQGGAVLVAAEKLLKDVKERAAVMFGSKPDEIEVLDGVAFSRSDPEKSVTLAQIAADAGGKIIQTGAARTGPGKGRALVRSVGACFAEVEVDIFTGTWKVKRVSMVQDTGKVINPLLSEGDMDGSFIQGLNTTSDSIPRDRTSPGFALADVGFLSYRMPTIKDIPNESSHVFIESLEPRWYFGYKSFGETAIGAIPSAIANAISNAIGVRIREHPITPDKILSAMKEQALSG